MTKVWRLAFAMIPVFVTAFACGKPTQGTCTSSNDCSGGDGGADAVASDAVAFDAVASDAVASDAMIADAPSSSPDGGGGGCSSACPSGTTCDDGGCVCTAASGCGGCCNGSVCEEAGAFPACGNGGLACTACDAASSDNCAAGGTCACGTSAPCGAGQGCCGGACIDVTSSAANCGACDHACAVGSCAQSNCQPVAVYVPAAPCPITSLAEEPSTPPYLYWIGCENTDGGPGGTLPHYCQVGSCTSPTATTTDNAVDAGSGPPSYSAVAYGLADDVPFAIHDLPNGAAAVEYGVLGWGLLDYEPHGASGLAVDGNYLFFGTGSGFIVRENLPAQTTINLMPIGGAIVVDANNVYANLPTSLIACSQTSTAGCGASPLTIFPGYVSVFAPDTTSQFIYASDGTNIYRCPVTGGCTAANGTWLTGTTQTIDAIVVDANFVYWLDAVQPTAGKVMKCAIGTKCTTPVTVATTPLGTIEQSPSFTQDTNAIYWSSPYGIYELSH